MRQSKFHRDIHDIRSFPMEQAMKQLMDNIEEMKTNNEKMLRCTEILTNIIERGKRGGSDDMFCVTHLTKQEVIELTNLGSEE